jgi:hypothetical protein
MFWHARAHSQHGPSSHAVLCIILFNHQTASWAVTSTACLQHAKQLQMSKYREGRGHCSSATSPGMLFYLVHCPHHVLSLKKNKINASYTARAELMHLSTLAQQASYCPAQVHVPLGGPSSLQLFQQDDHPRAAAASAASAAHRNSRSSIPATTQLITQHTPSKE